MDRLETIKTDEDRIFYKRVLPKDDFVIGDRVVILEFRGCTVYRKVTLPKESTMDPIIFERVHLESYEMFEKLVDL